MKQFWSWLLVWGICFITSFGRDAAQPNAAVPQAIKSVLANYEAMNACDFEVAVHCPEVEKVVSERVMSQFGIPLKPRMVMTHEAGQKLLKVKMNLDELPEKVRKVAEDRLNREMAPYLAFFGFLDSELAERVLRAAEASSNIDLIEATPEVLDLELNELNEPLALKSIKSARVRLDLARGTIKECRFFLGQNEELAMKLTTTLVSLPTSAERLYVPNTIVVHQTAFREGEIQAPADLTIQFGEYKFGPKLSKEELASRARAAIFPLQCKEQLKKLGFGEKCVIQPDKTLALNLTGLSISNLSPLHDMPISILNLQETKVTDLSALPSLPLKSLDLTKTAVEDLRPLRGMKLNRLVLKSTPVTDLSPLAGMPLTELDITGLKTKDLSALRGMPLVRLVATSTLVDDLSALRGLPLQNLSIVSTRVADLQPLQGMPLHELSCSQTAVTNLTPLVGMPLTGLNLTATPITDLQPLRSLPLKHLLLSKCTKLQDLTPLADCKELEVLNVPDQCRDIEFLRQLPRLQYLSYTSVSSWKQIGSAAEFWKEFDAKKAARK